MALMSQLGHASLQDYRDAVAAKASMKRCSICGGSGAIHDSDDYPIERCYHCKGLGYEKVVDLSERALLELVASSAAVSGAKKTQVDPFGGFNF
jgi:DnaJ-class molecular chaperone